MSKHNKPRHVRRQAPRPRPLICAVTEESDKRGGCWLLGVHLSEPFPLPPDFDVRAYNKARKWRLDDLADFIAEHWPAEGGRNSPVYFRT